MKVNALAQIMYKLWPVDKDSTTVAPSVQLAPNRNAMKIKAKSDKHRESYNAT